MSSHHTQLRHLGGYVPILVPRLPRGHPAYVTHSASLRGHDLAVTTACVLPHCAAIFAGWALRLCVKNSVDRWIVPILYLLTLVATFGPSRPLAIFAVKNGLD